MSRRTAEASKAISAAWEREQQLVQAGQGTRDWTAEQQTDILTKGKAYDDNGRAFEGHHMISVENNPDYQGCPENIQFLSRMEHQAAHDGNFQNPTNGYFNPITGETTVFEDGVYSPCEITELSEPVDQMEAEQEAKEKAAQEHAEREAEEKAAQEQTDQDLFDALADEKPEEVIGDTEDYADLVDEPAEDYVDDSVDYSDLADDVDAGSYDDSSLDSVDIRFSDGGGDSFV